jgi:hypothetical protein
MSTVGMAWYDAEAWRQLEAIPEADIQKSYRDFVRTFETLARKIAAQGFVVEKIPVDVEQMRAWCHRHGYEIDERRAVYGTMLLMARDHPDALDAPVIDNTRTLQRDRAYRCVRVYMIRCCSAGSCRAKVGILGMFSWLPLPARN